MARLWSWFAMALLVLGLTLAVGCPEDDDDDAGDDDTGDDDSAGDDDAGDDDSVDPNDQDGDGSSITDDPPDCDDQDPTVYPGAWELWDYQDNDCDNDYDEQMPLHRQCMLQGQALEGMGVSLLAPGDLSGDDLADLLIGTAARGVLLFEGSATRCEYDTDTSALPGWSDPGSGDSGFGTTLAYTDLDNDGQVEIAIGAPLDDAAGEDAGAVYLYDTGDGDLYDLDATISGTAAGQNLGITLAGGEDIDADGFADLLVAGRLGSDTWEVHLFLGSNQGLSGSMTPADADAVLQGAMDEATDRIAIGFAPDLNGDNAGELLIGTPDAGAMDEGHAYLLLSRVVWTGVVFGSAEVEFLPLGVENEYLGLAVGSVGNLVGGASDDFYVSAPGWNGPGSGVGRVHLFGGDEHSWLGNLTYQDAESNVRASRAQDFGFKVIGIGDIELDGYDDMVVLTMLHELDDFGYGALYFIRGHGGGLPEDQGLNDSSMHYLAEDNDYLGPSLVRVGDMDGDGYDDIAAGDQLSGFGDGRVYVLYTPESPLAE